MITEQADRRRTAAIAACEGLPTEWLERGLVQELYKFVAVMALADKMSEHKDGYVRTPDGWWEEYVRGSIDRLNEIAKAGQGH